MNEDITGSCVVRLNIVEIPILPKLIYRLKATPIKKPQQEF